MVFTDQLFEGETFTCVAAQQGLVGEVAHEVLKAGKLVEPKHVDFFFACHMEMFDRVLGPAGRTTGGSSEIRKEKLGLAGLT